MQVTWQKLPSGNWANARQVDYTKLNVFGVYIMWIPGTVLTGPCYIRIGQGNVADRIQQHLRTPEIAKYPTLYFTCADVSRWQVDGVERFLADRLFPMVGDRFPEAPPIPVNLPFASYY